MQPFPTGQVEQGRGIAPIRFSELLDRLVSEPELRGAIEALLVHKRSAKESEYGKPWPAINAFIDRELTRLELVSPPVHLKIDFSGLDRLLMDFVIKNTLDADRLSGGLTI